MNDNYEESSTLTPPPSEKASASVVGNNERRRKKSSFEFTKSFLLGKRIKTTLSDGRTLTGKFICIDRLKNIILTNVTEERFIDPSDYRYRFCGDGDDEKNDNNDDDDGDSSMGSSRRIRVERHISQAMIPGSRLVKAEISQSV